MNLARSPYIIEINESGQTGSKIELFLWNTGTQPTYPQYTLSKLIPASNKPETYYNISPYVREYFTFTKWQNATGLTYNQDTSDNYIVQYAVKRYQAVSGVYTLIDTLTGTFSDGFGYYEEGYNPAAPSVLLDEGTYFYNYDASISTAQNNGIWGSFDVQMSTGDSIKYTDLSDGSTITYVSASDGVKSFARVYLTYAPNGNKVEYIVGGTTRWTGYFKPQCEPKYQPVTIDFVNRYGSWSRIFFQKAKTRSIEVKANQYKFNPKELPWIPQDIRQSQEFNINGKETIKLNTGWVNDGYAEYLQQLMFSEKILICDYENNQDYAPVKLKTKNIKKQTGLNNGMMNYTLDFEFAYDMINNVM
jgi:hypothetical protein